jgi:hypothetical protein
MVFALSFENRTIGLSCRLLRPAMRNTQERKCVPCSMKAP